MEILCRQTRRIRRPAAPWLCFHSSPLPKITILMIAQCMSALDTQYKEKQIFSLPLSPPVRSPPVWPCKRLCALLRSEVDPAPFGRYGPGLGRCLRSFEWALPPLPMALRRTKRKAGERAGCVTSPARPLLPAVRAVFPWRKRGCKGGNIGPAGSYIPGRPMMSGCLQALRLTLQPQREKSTVRGRRFAG